MNKKDVYSVTDRLGQREEKKVLDCVCGKSFVRDSNPGQIERQSICITTSITKYPHDLASTECHQNLLFIAIGIQ